jgi:hypothetical protein
MIRNPLLRARVSAPRTNGVDHILPGGAQPRHLARALLVVVFDAFLGLEDRILAARHDGLHARRRRTEGRRHLRGFDDTEATAGTSADEEDAAAATQRLCDDLHAVRNAVAFTMNRGDHLPVFGDHQVDELADGRFVECEAVGVDGFGGE